MLAEIRAEKDKLKALMETAKELDSDTDSAAISMTHEYLCVAICGRVEQDIKTVLIEYSKRKSDAKLERAIARLCRNLMNPEPTKIIDTLELFDRDLSRALKAEWQEDDSVGSILGQLVGQRKRIARQTSSSRHMTATKIDEFYRAYLTLLERLDRHFLN